MKSLLKIRQSISALLAILVFSLPVALFGQTEGSGNVQKETRSLPEFNRIEVGSAFTVYLTKGEPNVTIETDDNLIKNNIETLVEDGTLIINSSGIKNPTSLKVYVSAPDITEVVLTGAARLESRGILEYPVFTLSAQGASRANIELNTQELTTEVAGASRVTLRGNANNHISEVTGASSVNALMLKTITTTAEVKGAGRMSVFAKNQLNVDLKDAGTVSYFDNPDIKKLRQTGEMSITLNNPDDAMPKESEDVLGNDIEFKVFDEGDSVFVKLKELEVHVDELDDMTKIGIGRHDIEIDDDGNVKVRHHKKEKYDGHWGGIEIGVNGLVYRDNNMTPPSEYSFLDQKMERSVNFALNLYEQNFNLIEENFGLTTGLGLEWNNYRLADDVVLNLDDDISARYGSSEDTNWIKSKFVTTYLTLPLMFEVQTNSMSKVNSFHAGIGVLSGLRIGTHTKVVYDDGDKETDKERGATSMNPFKLELMARLGWGKINVYGKYALTELFKENRGPEAHPFSVGITLINW
ncbi:MAG TPA: DUF2807 domain-containing protein [Lentimicrobium sp.]|nr:DUF2807 domain-containing protein [Lentimicrobium sp.]